MAIKHTNGNAKTIYLEYSSTAGMLLVSNDANREVLKRARELVGEEAWKRGFDGPRGKTVSAQVREFLDKNDIRSVTLDGELVAAYYSEREHSNGVYQDIRMMLVDRESGEGYLVTLPLASSAGQMLVRKLANDVVGRGTRISAFSAFPGNGRKDEKTDRIYFDSSVMLKDAEGEEIKQAGGIFDAGIADVKAKMTALEQSGITDRKVLNSARASATVSFYREILVSSIKPKFPSEDRSTGSHDAQTSHASNEPVGMPASDGDPAGYDDGVAF